MRITVKVRPNSKEEKVEKIGPAEFSVRVREPAKEGKANGAVIRVMSEYLNVPKSSIEIIMGHGGRSKVLEIYGG